MNAPAVAVGSASHPAAVARDPLLGPWLVFISRGVLGTLADPAMPDLTLHQAGTLLLLDRETPERRTRSALQATMRTSILAMLRSLYNLEGMLLCTCIAGTVGDDTLWCITPQGRAWLRRFLDHAFAAGAAA